MDNLWITTQHRLQPVSQYWWETLDGYGDLVEYLIRIGHVVKLLHLLLELDPFVMDLKVETMELWEFPFDVQVIMLDFKRSSDLCFLFDI